MSFPISELINREVLVTISGVKTVAAYSSNLKAELFEKGGDNSVGDLVAVIGFGDDIPAPEEDVPIGYEGWIRPYYVLVQIFEGAPNMPYDQRVNAVTSDIQKAAMRDPTWRGHAENTFLSAPQRFDDPNDITGVAVRFDVHWRHLDGNPYSK